MKGVQRSFLNDVVTIDPITYEIKNRSEYPYNLMKGRIYHSGFIIDDFIYMVGGMTKYSKRLKEFIEIDLLTG